MGKKKAIENNCKDVFYHVGNLLENASGRICTCLSSPKQASPEGTCGVGWVGAALVFLQLGCHFHCFSVVLGKYRAARCFSV